MNMKFLKYTILSLAALTALSACEKSASDVYENKVYIDEYASNKLLYISIEDSYQESLVAALPKPAESILKVKCSVDESLVSYYNERNNTNAVILPSANYSFSTQELTINQGGVRSDECVINFKDILTLDGKVLYVLPVRLSSGDIDVLSSRSTKYYVFEGAKLINDVAYMYDNYCEINWNNPAPLCGLKQFTVEMLLNCDWDKNKDERRENNSIFGIEGYFLLRTADLSNPTNRLQVCTNSGEPLIGDMPKNEWFNLILTYDADTRTLGFYINGEKVSETKAGNYPDGVNFYPGEDPSQPFRINTAYNNIRTAAAMFSEVRIWNKILDDETIADKSFHPYFVKTDSEGLVSYWKFNEGTGSVIADRTGNGNNLTAIKPIEWRKVALPLDE